MSRAALPLLASLLIACACASATPSQPGPEREPERVLGRGRCGGLTDRPEGAPIAILGGRLTLRPLGSNWRLRAVGSGGVSGSTLETALSLPTPTGELVVWTRERFERPPAGELLPAAEAHVAHDPRYLVRAVDAEGLEVAAAIPRVPIPEDRGVLLARLFTRTPDDLVQETLVVADAATAESGGCQRLALRLAETLRPGRRELPLHRGRVALRPGVTIDLPTEGTVQVSNRPGHEQLEVHPIRAFGAEDPLARLTVHLGPRSAWTPPEAGRHWQEPLAGVNADWYQGRSLEGPVRHGVAHVPELGPLRVTMVADSRMGLEALQEIANTLSTEVPAEPLPGCDAIEARAPRSSPALDEDPAVRALASAERFVRSAASFTPESDDDASPLHAFRQLLARADAAVVFEHLAAQEATVARLYGLAGLAALEDEAFHAVFCAVAPDTTGTIEVLDLCERQEVSVGSLLEVEAAPEDPGFWRAAQWRAASGPKDIWGRGLGRELAWGPLVGAELQMATERLGGVSWPADETSSAAPFEGDRRAALVQLGAGQLCTTRSDGRWACWGPEAEWLFPAALRHPAAVAGQLTPCFVDREGRRACAGAALDEALAVRAETCGGEAPAARAAYRSFTDGPWRLIDLGVDACGIDAGGALHCFATRPAQRPRWVSEAAGGFGEPWRVPLPAAASGAARGHGTTRWAWTEEGHVVRWNDRDPPRVVARLDGLKRLVAGMRITFAEMDDGRVLALGPAPGEPWWDVVGALEPAWVEVPELRGARLTVGAYHGCALFDRGRVRCWGSDEAGQVSAEDPQRNRELTEVRAFQGARSLHLSQGASCALLRGDLLRCIGQGAEGLGDSRRGGVTEVRLRRRADAVRASVPPDEERPLPP